MSEIKNILQEEVAEGGMTGADFNYVLGSAQGAESHFRWLELLSSNLILSLLGPWLQPSQIMFFGLSEGSSLSFTG